MRDMASPEAIEELIAEVPNRPRLLAAFAGASGGARTLTADGERGVSAG
jgi:hypothetical protein